MGFLFGVQPPLVEDGIEFRRLRTGATDAHVLWFEARDLASGISVKADELEGKPGVMSTRLAAGDEGKQRLISKLLDAVEEFT